MTWNVHRPSSTFAPDHLVGEHLRELVVPGVAQHRNGVAHLEVARTRVATSRSSILAAVCALLPDVPPVVLSKTMMYDVSRAIEDEAAAHDGGAVLLGAFQEARFWDDAESRWRDLARTSGVGVALASFEQTTRRGRLWQVAVRPEEPVAAEWALVVDGDAFTACLVGVERRAARRTSDRRRRFEAIWTVEPDVVREAARAGAAIAAEHAPRLGRVLDAQLGAPATASPASLRAATALTNRILRFVERRRR